MISGFNHIDLGNITVGSVDSSPVEINMTVEQYMEFANNKKPIIATFDLFISSGSDITGPNPITIIFDNLGVIGFSSVNTISGISRSFINLIEDAVYIIFNVPL